MTRTDVVNGTSTITRSFDGDRGFVVTFFNNPVFAGGQGCTPGYWRQEHHFDSSYDYAPSELALQRREPVAQSAPDSR